MAETAYFGPRKTILILGIVVGCFAVLWPRIFYPMLTASVTPTRLPSDGSACCDVIFESDITAVDIVWEICQNVLRHHQVDPRVKDALKMSKLTPQSTSLCREEVLARCGIDLSSFLAEKERLGKNYKQVLEEIRAYNSSLCLKVNFGIPLSQLGTPHLIRYHILMPHNPIKQERRTPPHAGGLHPAMRERGRAIPASHIVPKVVDRPEHVIPKMRPTLGGAGHVVPAPKVNGTMGIIMPLYTVGIVLFFLYTIVKVMKKSSDSEIISHYGEAAEKEFRDVVFSPDVLTTAMTGGTVPYCRKQRSLSPLKPAPTIEELKEQAAGDIEIDQLRRRLVETEAAMERIVVQMGNISRSVMNNSSSQPETKEIDSREADVDNSEHSAAVKVVGVDLTASCEGGQRCSRPPTPVTPTPPHQADKEKTPPVPIYLEGALPPQCELLVTDSETQEQQAEENAEAPVVLSGKMTLSLISLDQIAAESTEENNKFMEIEKNNNGQIPIYKEHTDVQKKIYNYEDETECRQKKLEGVGVENKENKEVYEDEEDVVMTTEEEEDDDNDEAELEEEAEEEEDIDEWEEEEGEEEEEEFEEEVEVNNSHQLKNKEKGLEYDLDNTQKKVLTFAERENAVDKNKNEFRKGDKSEEEESASEDEYTEDQMLLQNNETKYNDKYSSKIGNVKVIDDTEEQVKTEESSEEQNDSESEDHDDYDDGDDADDDDDDDIDVADDDDDDDNDYEEDDDDEEDHQSKSSEDEVCDTDNDNDDDKEINSSDVQNHWRQ